MHPLRLWLMVVAIWLASVSLAAAASLDTAVARYTATSDGQAAYVQAVAAHFGAVDNSASKASSGAADDDGAGRARVWTHLEAAGIPDDTYTHPSYAERKKLYGHAAVRQQ